MLYKYNRANKRPVDHIGFATEWPPNIRFPFFTALDGNTSAPRGGSDTRQGVWEKQRLKAEVKYKLDIIPLINGSTKG